MVSSKETIIRRDLSFEELPICVLNDVLEKISNNAGKLVVINVNGLNDSGKTTIASKLKDAIDGSVLINRGRKFDFTPLGYKVRCIILDTDCNNDFICSLSDDSINYLVIRIKTTRIVLEENTFSYVMQ